MAGKPPKVWAELWVLPQAAAWEELHLHRVVARYAAKLVQAEKRDAPASLQAEVRHLEDRLGLSPMAMLRLRWAMGRPDESAADHDNAVASIDEYRQMLRGG